MKIFKRNHIIPLYETTVQIFVVEKIEHLQTYINKKDKEGANVLGNDGCVFQLVDSNYNWCIAFVKDRISHNIIAHETYHLTSKIGDALDVHEEEARAWIMGHLIEIIYNVFTKKEFVIKNR